jgi:hypothetical protein
MKRDKVYITGGDGEYLRMAEVMIRSLKSILGDADIRVYSFDCDYSIEGVECTRINLPYTPSFSQEDPIDIAQNSVSSYWGKYHATIHSLNDYNFSVWLDSDSFVTENIDRIWKYSDRASEIDHPLFMEYFLGDASYWLQMPDSDMKVFGMYGSEACHMFKIKRNPFQRIAAAGIYLAHSKHIPFLKECMDLRYESIRRRCYYYADDKAFSEERVTNVVMWKHGYSEFLPFTWINSMTEKNLDRFPDHKIKNTLLSGFDVMFDRQDNEIVMIHGPNSFRHEKTAENLNLIREALVSPDSDKLMIVCHPDDEMIFGGSALISEDGWRVVCLTNQRSKERLTEIEKSMHRCGILDYVIHDLEDRIEIPLDEDATKSIISEEINSKDWKIIVTHNNIGEYGHPHHFQVHNEVKSQLEGKDKLNKLWVFDKQKEKIPQNILDIKNYILDSVYSTQKEIISQIRENRGRWFIDKDMETNYIENGTISRYKDSSVYGDPFVVCYIK